MESNGSVVTLWLLISVTILLWVYSVVLLILLMVRKCLLFAVLGFDWIGVGLVFWNGLLIALGGVLWPCSIFCAILIVFCWVVYSWDQEEHFCKCVCRFLVCFKGHSPFYHRSCVVYCKWSSVDCSDWTSVQLNLSRENSEKNEASKYMYRLFSVLHRTVLTHWPADWLDGQIQLTRSADRVASWLTC